MKKIFTLCLTFCFVLTLAGCGDSKTSSSGADNTPAASTESKVESNTESNTESKTESSTESNTESSAGSDVDPNDMSYPENPYAPHEITGAEIIITDTKKIIKNTSFTISVPLDWECLEINGEDGGSLLFSHPTLGEKCRLIFHITGAEYKTNRTQDEYLKVLRYITADDVRIESFTAEKLDGTDCTKIVSTYSKDNTKFERVDYREAVRGSILYNVVTTRPSENSELESVLNNIVESIKFSAKG